jgi:uncharacterized protein (TIGR00251 family)
MGGNESDGRRDIAQFWTEHGAGVLLALKVRPGARRSRIRGIQPAASRPGWPDVRLAVEIAAPPEDGRANEAVIALLAGALEVRRGDIEIVSGRTAREKLLSVAGPTTVLAARLAALAVA